MTEVKEVKEIEKVKEVEDVKEKNCSVAAFFDLDGTLTPLPSLERRFLRELRYRRAILPRNYWLWLAEVARLMPRGISSMLHANKMYLRGVQIFDESDRESSNDAPLHKSGHQAKGQASASRRAKQTPRWPVPVFFREALQRVEWHARQCHAIVLVSGTLEPLANAAAEALKVELRLLGIAVQVRVCATQLEEAHGRWTGKIVGEAMFAEAKAQAVRALAEEMQLDLAHCWAYGDCANDRWLLASVGHAAAVNPSAKLARIARQRGWHILRWAEVENLTQRHRVRRATEKRKDRGATGECPQQEPSRDLREQLRPSRQSV